MTPLERVLDLELIGDAGSARAWRDLAEHEHGFTVEVISDERAEELRVERATGEPTATPIVDRIPWARVLVTGGGLKAISPSAGGNLKAWMAARVARLWRGRGAVLFEYLTKKRNRHRMYNPERGRWETVATFPNIVRKKQRWETLDYVDLGVGDSPAHLSGFGSGADGSTKYRGVLGPRGEPDSDEVAPLELRNRQFDFTGGT